MDSEQFRRYSRHILLREIDEEGQQHLLDAHALIIGLGGLGSAAAMYLASSGVGALTLCDYDNVDLSNLQRQIIHNTESIGEKKVVSARKQLLSLNPDIKIQCLDHALSEAELGDFLATNKVDIVLDASDNFPTRYLLNRICAHARTPLVSAAAIRYQGQLSTFTYQKGAPCYQCLYADMGDHNEQDTCDQLGVLAPLTGALGCLQAAEALKTLAGFGEILSGRLLTVDLLSMQIRTLTYNKDPACPVCSNNH